MPERTEHHEGVGVEAALAPELADFLARFHEGHLAALEPVPRMVGVVVVGAEHRVEHVARVDVDRRRELARRFERRFGKDAAEIEKDGVEASLVHHVFIPPSTTIVEPVV
jgi:hypothetical protein